MGRPDERADEVVLIERARRGDRSAMDALLRRHYDTIWAICRRIAGNDADAADATQEALLLVVRRLDTFDGRARFSTWLHRLTTNACLDELRRRRRRPDPGLPDEVADRVGSGAEAPDRHVAERLALDAALRALPEEFRVPVVLRDVVGHDYAEIADILEIPPGTVRSRIARGRRRLVELLDRPGSDDGNPTPSSRRHTDDAETDPAS